MFQKLNAYLVQFFQVFYILFQTSVHLKNAYYPYSACSNLTNLVLVIVLNMILGKGARYLDLQTLSVCNQ